MIKPDASSDGLLRFLPFARRRKRMVTEIALAGVIRAGAAPGRGGLSLAALQTAIEAAFKPKRLSAVALIVNSPGGSAVQSQLIYRAIRRAAAKKGVPVLAFAEDVAASGGYWLALAGDEIYADASSIIGSIGVIAAGFGLQDAIARIGVERRIYTSGESKSQLDPFRPEKSEDVQRLQIILEDIHKEFVAVVRERRGARLKQAEDLFTGAFWSAEGALARGLIDGVAHAADLLRTRFGEDVKIRRIEPKKSFLTRIFRGASSGIGAPVFRTDEAIADLEAQALWSRYGL